MEGGNAGVPGELNILRSVSREDGSEIPVRLNEESIEAVSRIRGNSKLVRLFEGLRTDTALRHLLWIHKYHLAPVKGLELAVVYDEAFPYASLEPLQNDEARGQAELEVQIWEGFRRFFPALMTQLFGMRVKLEAEFNQERAAQPALPEDTVRQAVTTKYVLEQILPAGDEGRMSRWISLGVQRAGDLIIPGAASLLSIGKRPMVQAGRALSDGLLDVTSLDRPALQKTISRLTKAYDIIHPALSVAWCPNCEREPQAFFALGQRDAPVSTCPVCRQSMAVGTFYYFDAPLAARITDPEGVLYATVLWSLASSGVKWAPGVYLAGQPEDTEKDAVFRTEEMDGYGIVECKVHYRDAPDRTMTDHLREDLDQLVKHVQAYSRAAVPVGAACLVSNLPQSVVDPEVKRALKEPRYAPIADILEAYGPENFEDFDKSVRPDEE